MPGSKVMGLFVKKSDISRVWVGEMWSPLIRHRKICVSGKLRLEKVIMNVLFHFKALSCPVTEILPFFRENPKFQECEWVRCDHLSLDTGKMALLKKFRSEKVIMNVPLHFKAFLCPVPKLWAFSWKNQTSQECEWVRCDHLSLDTGKSAFLGSCASRK